MIVFRTELYSPLNLLQACISQICLGTRLMGNKWLQTKDTQNVPIL